MKFFRIIIVLLGLLIYYSCTKREGYWKSIPQKGNNISESILHDLHCDTIMFDNIHTTHTGHWIYARKSFVFLDKILKFTFEFSPAGDLVGRHNGLGQGPNEFVVTNSMLTTLDGSFVLGDFTSYYLLDKSFKITKKSDINWIGEATNEEIYNHPSPDMIGIYEVLENQDNPRVFKGNILLPINTEHFKYNGFISKDYYKNTRIFAVLDTMQGKIISIEGRRSLEYLKYEFLPNFDYFHFDCDENNIYVNYDIDSMIYVLDEKFSPIYKFGRAGENMKCEYKETSNYKDAEVRFQDDRMYNGHYDYLKKIKETGMVFRTYSKGGKKSEHGLQIYDQNYNLIGDVPVPYNFKVIGYADGEYFAECESGIKSNKMYILKFKL